MWGNIGRRSFVVGSTLVLTPSWYRTAQAQTEPSGLLKVGLLTDMHYADKPPAGTRHYRETLDKLKIAQAQFENTKPDFVVQLGDLIDAASTVETEQQYLATIHQDFVKLSPHRHHVLGNHCVDMLTKAEFLQGVGQAQSYYSFDRAGYHFVILDACFRSDHQPYGRKNSQWTDSNIPPEELAWLRTDLQQNPLPVIVFAHQRLDETKQHSVKNAAEVRQILQHTGRVLGVFQGHSHQNDHQLIEGIHYTTLAALVEGSGPEHNAFSQLELHPNGTLQVTGFHRQKNYHWPHTNKTVP